MAEEKAITNQETGSPSEGEKKELSQEELNTVSGGIVSPRDPQSGLPTGQ
jgi:bacteriocin-like protein